MAAVAVYGAGGHGRDVAEVARAAGHSVLMRDDNPALGHPCTAAESSAEFYLLGMNDGRTRELMARRVARNPHHLPALGSVVHPSSAHECVPRSGAGLVIASGVKVGPEVVLGVHVHIGAGTFLTRCTVGDFTTFGPNVSIGGDVRIGSRVTVGIGATIANFVTLDDDVLLGAGAVVPPHRHLTAGTWVGCPAQELL